MRAGEEHYYRSADGLQLFFRCFPSNAPGMPILCLPGITRNSRDFVDLARYLAGRHTVIAPDFRGRGYSQHDPEWRNYHPRTYVADVLTLLDKLDIDRAVFFGTSLGGIVATIVAAEAQDRVAAVVLNDIGPEIGAAGLARIKGYIGRAQPVHSWDEAVSQARDLYEPAWPGLGDDDWQRLVRRSYRVNDSGEPMLDMDPMVGEAAREVGTNLDEPWALFDALAAKPLLVLQGALSDILTDDIVLKMRQRKPDLRHVKIGNRGHVPLLDEPDSIAAIDSFLEALK